MLLRIIISLLFINVVFCCTEGRDNVIKLYDTSPGNSGIQFNGLELWTYDEQKRPACQKGKAVIVTPGHLKLSGGTMKLSQISPDYNVHSLHIHLSAEQNSWVVGKVCKNGKSVSTFVSDKKCKHNVCKTMGGHVCGMLKLPEVASLTEIPEEARQMFAIPAAGTSYAEGEWKLSMQIVDEQGRVMTSLRVGEPNAWITVTAGSSSLDRNVRYAHEEL